MFAGLCTCADSFKIFRLPCWKENCMNIYIFSMNTHIFFVILGFLYPVPYRTAYMIYCDSTQGDGTNILYLEPSPPFCFSSLTNCLATLAWFPCDYGARIRIVECRQQSDAPSFINLAVPHPLTVLRIRDANLGCRFFSIPVLGFRMQQQQKRGGGKN